MKTMMEGAGWPLLTVVSTAACLALSGVAWTKRRQAGIEVQRRQRVDALYNELYAYAQCDPRIWPGETATGMAERVCRTIAENGPFHRVAMLLRHGEGRIYVAGSVQMDDLVIEALERWGTELPEGVRSDGRVTAALEGALGHRLSEGSFAVGLDRRRPRREEVDAQAMEMVCRGVIVIPMWTARGRFAGALAVCTGAVVEQRGSIPEDLLRPMEALAVKLGRSVEAAGLAEQLLRAEKLAGLGQLAGGVAHALNNPLTAVMGYAELMADTAREPTVRRQAGTILDESKRMRDTVQHLLNFWRPQTLTGEVFEITPLLEELEDACASKLESRGVQFVIQAGEAMPPVRGSRERLREALEHLLNNAAEAISAAQEAAGRGPGSEAELVEHVIRLTANYNAGALHLIVSDTGSGFREPRRVFDPFYSTGGPAEGSGLGLSICYAIVREHGGEISAFNLHPRGAAVVLELPVREAMVADRLVVREVA